MKARWLAVAALAALFGALTAIVAPLGGPTAIDADVADWMVAHRTDAGVAVFTGISAVGSLAGLVAIGAALARALHRRGGWRRVAWLAAGMAGAWLLYAAVNVPVGRPRPPLGMRIYADRAAAFPSGHSTQAAAFWLVATVLATADHSPRVQRRALALAPIAILAIGASRLYLCAHWLTDVIGGLTLGTLWAVALLAVRARTRR